MVAILLNSILVASWLAGWATRPEAQLPDVTSELKQMQQELLKALLEGRRDDYAAMLAPEWRVTYVDGTVRVKADVLNDVFGGPKPLLKAGRFYDVEVREIRPDLAVINGRTEATPQEGDTVHLRFVDVAMKRNGRWLITSSFATFTP